MIKTTVKFAQVLFIVSIYKLVFLYNLKSNKFLIISNNLKLIVPEMNLIGTIKLFLLLLLSTRN
ncbi:hypothetical protein Mgra_00006455 [Meloidogyne graminicola]|uniref:Uncharacterized protein n=1 Tax=Meloidogyne graminicola TaxID=189291 RepID=A0A8S9ZL19_9BILA|nr:hypothetical protein Mgra_00006455 [Meloidogyne graminicola]